MSELSWRRSVDRLAATVGASVVAMPAGGGAGRLGNGGATFLPANHRPEENATNPVLPDVPDFEPSSSVSRWALLSRIQRLCRPADKDKRGPAVCGCGRPGYDVDQVAVHLRASELTGELRAGVSGVYRCGSPWLCPVCAVAKAKDRAERVRVVAEATYKKGGQVVLVVLTASHEAATPLADFKGMVQGGSRKARQGAPWTRIVERHGIVGVVVGQEVTLSWINGWHYHQHLSIPVAGPTAEEIEAAGGDAEALAAMVHARAQAAGEAVAGRYKTIIRAAGGKVSDEHGTYVRVAENEADAADYTAKGSLAWEVAGGATKDKTRAKGSMTPWDLAEAAYAGDGWARDRWAEYVEVMPGTRSCVVSAALAAKLDITPADMNDEDGEQILHETEDVVGQVASPTWRRWMRHGLASTFLARVEYGGEEGFVDAVDRTNVDADAIEARYQAVQAEREAAEAKASQDRAHGRRMTMIRIAVADLQNSGARTLDQVRRVCANIGEMDPTAPPLDEMDIIREMAKWAA